MVTERGLNQKGVYICKGCGELVFTGFLPKYCKSCYKSRENQKDRERYRRGRGAGQ